jgi:hypothetical protein
LLANLLRSDSSGIVAIMPLDALDGAGCLLDFIFYPWFRRVVLVLFIVALLISQTPEDPPLPMKIGLWVGLGIWTVIEIWLMVRQYQEQDVY